MAISLGLLVYKGEMMTLLVLSGAIVESAIVHEKILRTPKRAIYIHQYPFYTFLGISKHFVSAHKYRERDCAASPSSF